MKFKGSQVGMGAFSGKGGSVVASHNRYGAYLRRFVIPVNPATDSQLDKRTFFTWLAQQWRELTEDQRIAWASLSEQVPVLDRLGDQIILQGNAFFAKVNILRRQVGNSYLAAAPALDAAPVVLTLTPTVDTTPTMDLAYTASGGAATNDIIVRATPFRSPGKTFVGRSELRQIAHIAGNAASPFDAQTAYEAVFGTGWRSLEGMEIVFEMQGLSENGLPGTPQRISALIEAGA